MEKKYDIFISYRREGGLEHARSVELALKGQGYKYIFFDYDSLRNGVFNEQIIDAINQCNDFILILSEHSMDRCSNEDDWVAREIRTAINSGCNIIPLTVGEFKDFPEDFPKKLRYLKDIQRTELLTNEYFDDSINHLIERLESKSENISISAPSQQVGATIHIQSDADCRVTDYGNDLGVVIKANHDTIITLKRGKHDLQFISKEERSITMKNEGYDVPDNDYCDKIVVKMRSDIDRLISKRKRDQEKQERKEREEELQRQKEEERLALENENNALKEVLPKCLSFCVSHCDGKSIVAEFKLDREKTKYLYKKHLSHCNGKDGIIGGIGSILNSIKDEFTIYPNIKTEIEKQGIKVIDSDYEMTIYVFDHKNRAYFISKYLQR